MPGAPACPYENLPDPDAEDYHLVADVYGRVQGVGFRYAARGEARRLKIRLRDARNKPDGSVHLEAEGPRAPLEEFLAWCRKGPPLAEVERVDFQFVDW